MKESENSRHDYLEFGEGREQKWGIIEQIPTNVSAESAISVR